MRIRTIKYVYCFAFPKILIKKFGVLLTIVSHCQSLIIALQNEFTIAGRFLDVMKAMLMPLPAFLAAEVRHAIIGWGSHERTLVEILCTASNVELDAIKAAYKRRKLISFAE